MNLTPTPRGAISDIEDRQLPRHIRVLLVDDSPVGLRLMVRLLVHRDCEDLLLLLPVRNATQAIAAIAAEAPDLVVTDFEMPYMDGVELAKHVRSVFPAVRVIVTSECDQSGLATRAIRAGAHAFCTKSQLTDVIGWELEEIWRRRAKQEIGGRAIRPGIPEKREHLESTSTVPAHSAQFLRSWKEIANYCRASVRTVQRWERDFQLPIHRMRTSAGVRIVAVESELGQWLLQSISVGQELSMVGSPPRPQRLNEQVPGSPGLLHSWKDIASHLAVSVREAQRWERELGLPIRRVKIKTGVAVFAVKPELDQWLDSRQLEETPRS
jgi:DNA-binding NarL/FixJ family response regulator